MTAAHIALADSDIDAGVSLVPATVPAGWTGAASSACQRQLDDLRIVLAGLTPLLNAAISAMSLLDDASGQGGGFG